MKKLKQFLKNFLIGKESEGEDIINKKPKFKTIYPDKKYSFNDIAENNRNYLMSSFDNGCLKSNHN